MIKLEITRSDSPNLFTALQTHLGQPLTKVKVSSIGRSLDDLVVKVYERSDRIAKIKLKGETSGVWIDELKEVCKRKIEDFDYVFQAVAMQIEGGERRVIERAKKGTE